MKWDTPVFKVNITIDEEKLFGEQTASLYRSRWAFRAGVLGGMVWRKTLPMAPVGVDDINVVYVPPEHLVHAEENSGVLGYQYSPAIWEKYKDFHIPLTTLEKDDNVAPDDKGRGTRPRQIQSQARVG